MAKSNQVMSNEEIHKLAKQEWVGVLAQLWLAYGKQIDKAQFQVYVNQLGRLPLGVLEAAISHLLKTHRYASVPTIADVMEAVEKACGNNWQDDDRYIPVFSTPNRDLDDRIRKSVQLQILVEDEVAI